MAKSKKTGYYDYLRQELGGLIEQLELPDLYKKALKRRWLDQVIWADKKAAECRRMHYRLRMLTIVGSVILPALVGLNFQLGKDNPTLRTWFPYVPFALSQVIAISAAVEEFCKFGDRWRDYRKMSEDLKAEGWQYLQLSGPYQYGGQDLQEQFEEFVRQTSARQAVLSQESESEEQSPTTHLESYSIFASRVEGIIKNDVQNYISELVKQQAKQEKEVEKYLESAQAVTQDKTLFAQANPSSAPMRAAPTATSGLSPVADNAAPVNSNLSNSYPVENSNQNGNNATLVNSNLSNSYPVENGNQNGNVAPVNSNLSNSYPVENGNQNGNVAQTLNSSPSANGMKPASTTPLAPVPVFRQPSVAPPTPPPPPVVPATPLPTQPSVQPAPTLDLNAAIVAAANRLRGISTAEGPDGGNNACAWTFNKVLKEAGIPPLGENPNYVPSLLEALQQGRGKAVSAAQAKAGDVVIADGEAHIGIVLDDNSKRVLSNSSSRACFAWESDIDFDGSYGGCSTIYRLVNSNSSPSVATPAEPPPPQPSTQPLSVEPTPTVDLNAAIVAAANQLRGMSTAGGPDGGNNACAWTLNKVLKEAGIPPLGENPNYVPSLVDALQKGRGKALSPGEVKAGDLVIAYEEAHIGIVLDDGDKRVLSNSSSRACFAWESDMDFDGSYSGRSTFYRLLC